MPPPISPAQLELRRYVAARGQRQPRSFEREQEQVLADTALDVRVMSGADFADFGRLEAGSSFESDSDEASSGLSESPTSEQLLAEGSALAAFRRRYEAHGPMTQEDLSQFVPNVTGAEDDVLSEDSDDSDRLSASSADFEEAELGLAIGRFVNREDSSHSPRDHERSPTVGSELDAPQSRIVHSAARRFLFSPAHQNITDEHSAHDATHARQLLSTQSLNAVPLRRQNAIRREVSTSSVDMSGKKIRSLKRTLKRLYRTIRNNSPTFGVSPLFSDHSWGNRLFPVLACPCLYNDESSLESRMNSLISNRRKDKLWIHSTHSDGPILIDHGGSLRSKRTCDSEIRHRAKRSKTNSLLLNDQQHSNHINETEYNSVPSWHLSNEDKSRILDGHSSSFLSGGATFVVGMGMEPSLGDVFELTVSEVGDGSTRINGFLRPLISGDSSLDTLGSFITMLVGDLRMADGTLVSEIFDDILKVMSSLSSPPSLKDLVTPITVPFLGNLIDFKNKDLRFFGENLHELRSNEPPQNDLIKFQLGEWLNIRPFSDFSESYFLNQLRFAIRCLKSFSKIPKKHQKAVYEFCEKIIEESRLVAKNLELIRRGKLTHTHKTTFNSAHTRLKEAKSDTSARFDGSTFTRRWKSEVCNSLGNFISCADPCLLNLQLNFILFTMELDIDTAISQVLRLFVKVKACDKPIKLLRQYFKQERASNEHKRPLLICSLNRKTGRLELLRIRSETESKVSSFSAPRRSAAGPRSYNIHSFDDDAYSGFQRSPGVDHRQTDGGETLIFNNSTRVMFGMFRKGRSSASSREIDVDHPSFV